MQNFDWMSLVFPVGLVIGSLLLAIYIARLISRSNDEYRARIETASEFQNAIVKCQSNPGDEVLQKDAIQTGHRCLETFVDSKGRSRGPLYTCMEVVIKNELENLQKRRREPAPQQIEVWQTVQSRLESLAGLMSKGLVSDLEFATLRDKILNDV